MMWYWILLIGVIFGMILGVLILTQCKSEGLLRIHYDDEDERPYLFLELNGPPEKIADKKYVVFKMKLDSRQ